MKKLLSTVLVLALALTIVAPATAFATASDTYATTPVYMCSTGQLTNIKLAVKALDGYHIANGATFSFNTAVGARTKARGYTDGVNGRGVEVTGGGVAQVATTLYLALKYRSDVTVTELHTYDEKYTGSYVSNSADAVVTDYSASTDFCFKNSSGSTLAISAYISGNYLYVRLYPDNSGEPTVSGNTASTVMASSSNLRNNVTLASNAIYGTTIYKNGKFSFNSVVGARTSARGYKDAINGRGVYVTGGGVAQVASTIYLAVKNMSCVTIVDKKTYGSNYNQSYVSNSSDAIVTDYSAGTDFSFVYTGSGRLVIYTYVSGDRVYCEVYEKF